MLQRDRDRFHVIRSLSLALACASSRLVSMHATAGSVHSEHNCLMLQPAPGSSNLVISAPAMLRTVFVDDFFKWECRLRQQFTRISHPPGTGLIRHQWRGAQMCLDVASTSRRIRVACAAHLRHLVGAWHLQPPWTLPTVWW